jgi:hypothetical protein
VSDAPGPAVRAVSLFHRDGKFFDYVYVSGNPRVVTYDGKTYVAYDAFGTTQSFREADSEPGRARGH